MRILHYTLGLPPMRRGGLTKYSLDLMQQQISDGDDVFLLFCGKSDFLNRAQIRKGKAFRDIICYEIINPPLIPLLEGIRDPETILKPKKLLNKEEIKLFFDTIKPDVFHVHTVMGLPFEVIVEAKELSIKIIYTTHDYFGLCPKINFINLSGENCVDNSGKNCTICCYKSPGFFKMNFIYNSPLKLLIKNNFSWILNLFRFFVERQKDVADINYVINERKIESFRLLTKYYEAFFSKMTFFHFNSYVSEMKFKHFLPMIKGSVISITHGDIIDKRKKRMAFKPVRIGFIGSTKHLNGFPILFNILSQLSDEGHMDWIMNVYSTQDRQYISPNLFFRGTFDYKNISSVFDDFDLLIVPRNETFSFIVLEAVSFGLPVLVSDNVGAKTIVAEYNPNFIFNNIDELKKVLLDVILNPSILDDFNRAILEKEFSYSIKEHAQKIKSIYN